MTARDVVDALVPEGRPRLRGWLHLGALPVAAALGVALVAAAPNGRGAHAPAI
jgi:hemolysin III